MKQHTIESVYHELQDDLKKVLEDRKVVMKKQRLMYGAYSIFIVVTVVYLIFMCFVGPSDDSIENIERHNRFEGTIAYIFIGIFLFYFFCNKFFGHSFATQFTQYRIRENKAISKMVARLFPSFEFSQILQLTKEEIKESKIFNRIEKQEYVYTYGSIHDFVYEGVDIDISDIGIIPGGNSGGWLIRNAGGCLMMIPYVTYLILFFALVEPILYAYSKNTADNLIYNFRGMFCKAAFPKRLKGHTVVLPKEMSTKIDRWETEFIEDERVKLEDVRFNKHFLVYGTDQIEARYILSTALMEKIVRFKERTGQNIKLSFLNNTIYVAIENPKGIFSFPGGEVKSIDVIKEIVEEINLAKYIVEDFNLNRNIMGLV